MVHEALSQKKKKKITKKGWWSTSRGLTSNTSTTHTHTHTQNKNKNKTTFVLWVTKREHQTRKFPCLDYILWGKLTVRKDIHVQRYLCVENKHNKVIRIWRWVEPRGRAVRGSVGDIWAKPWMMRKAKAGVEAHGWGPSLEDRAQPALGRARSKNACGLQSCDCGKRADGDCRTENSGSARTSDSFWFRCAYNGLPL
jgi:hypothetical protein